MEINIEPKLEFTHLAPYLPYGLKARLSHIGRLNLDSEYPNEHQGKIGIIRNFGIYKGEVSGELQVTNKYTFDFEGLEELEIILRPLSDLTKEIEHNGERFIPLERIRHINLGHCDWISTERDHWISMYGLSGWLGQIPYAIVNKLFEWNFDVFGLIDKGLVFSSNEFK